MSYGGYRAWKKAGMERNSDALNGNTKEICIKAWCPTHEGFHEVKIRWSGRGIPM